MHPYLHAAKHPDKPVIIWVAVAGDEVFVRSVRGPRGVRLYDALARVSALLVRFGGH